jgi:hypothetical protein
MGVFYRLIKGALPSEGNLNACCIIKITILPKPARLADGLGTGSSLFPESSGKFAPYNGSPASRYDGILAALVQ